MPSMPKVPSYLSYLALSLPWLCRSLACLTIPVLIQPDCSKKFSHPDRNQPPQPRPCISPAQAQQYLPSHPYTQWRYSAVAESRDRMCATVTTADIVTQRGCSRPAPTYSPQRTTLSRRQPCLWWATLTSAVALMPQVGYPQPIDCVTNPHQTALHSAAAALPRMGHMPAARDPVHGPEPCSSALQAALGHRLLFILQHLLNTQQRRSASLQTHDLYLDLNLHLQAQLSTS